MMMKGVSSSDERVMYKVKWWGSELSCHEKDGRNITAIHLYMICFLSLHITKQVTVEVLAKMIPIGFFPLV